MHTRPYSWRVGASLIAAVCAVSFALVPAFAASPFGHGAKSQAHAGKVPDAQYKQLNCTKRNKAAGTAKYSDWQFPDTLNPYQTGASVSTETIISLLEGLTLFDHSGAVRPDLLNGLPKPDKTGKVWTATLKKGTKWSNGKEITNKDVKFGWQLAMNKVSGPWCSGSCDVISRIDLTGKYGMVFHLKSPAAPFVSNDLPPVWPTSWSGGWGNGDVNAAVSKLWSDSSFNFENTTFPTNGAYQVTEFVPNDRIVLKPMKYYQTLSCGAKVSQLIFAFYSSKPALIAAAAAHQTDVSTDYTLADVPELLKHTDSFHVHTDPGYLVEGLWLNADKTYNGSPNPLNSDKVRVGLALVLDKFGLIQSALGMSRKQAGTIIAWTPLIVTKALIQPFADTALKGQWDPLQKKYVTDTGTGKALADGKKLLSQAGFSSGFSLEGVTTVGNPVRVAQFAVVQASWAHANVKFTPDFIPASKLFADWDHGSPLPHGQFQVAMYATVGYPDPDGFKYTFQSQYIERERTIHPCQICGNNMGMHDPIIDKAFNDGFKNLTKAGRQKAYNTFQVELNQKAWIIPLFYRGSIDTDDGHVSNFATNPTNNSSMWNTFSWTLKG